MSLRSKGLTAVYLAAALASLAPAAADIGNGCGQPTCPPYDIVRLPGEHRVAAPMFPAPSPFAATGDTHSG